MIKLAACVLELYIPYVTEHLIDHVVPTRDAAAVIIWGFGMIMLAVMAYVLNVIGNRLSVIAAERSTYRMRRDLFSAALRLSGSQIDRIGLPSIITRMTSDSYNVQNFTRTVQTVGIRAPFVLIGGIAVTFTMDAGLASVLSIMAPILIIIVVTVSFKGVALYNGVQKCMDGLMRVMRENITGIRVVKALSREEHEKERFAGANAETARKDISTGIVMAMPGPTVSMFLNVGFVIVVVLGSYRVNGGETEPGVILAFLTYFNMILSGVRSLNNILMKMSKANASAKRIAEVIEEPEDLVQIPESDAASTDNGDCIVFENVSFSYDSDYTSADKSGFLGQDRSRCLDGISFSVPKGGSLGIIGATGSGKTSIINLLMRFYDPQGGHIFVDGRDIRTYEPDDLRSRFGTVFQNDVIFADTIRENVIFGRNVGDGAAWLALRDAMAEEFVNSYEDGIDHLSMIHGANFSGGQKQRILIARALAADPEILVLDDSSSALDYRTDADLRAAIREHHGKATSIVIAQRVSSIMSLDRIMVLDEGRIIGYGTHDELTANCPQYREIYENQMGEV